MDVVELARRGINLVVIRMEIDYKGLLRSGDRFLVGLNTERISRVRIGFNQEIYRLKPCENPEKDAVQTDGASETVEMEKRILQARTTVTAVNERGRPCLTPELERLLGEMAL
jgi:acyl-CoA thioester hydrolase